ncbi:MAG TPA: thiamine phosphate synthase [Candidatus Methylomirabilis sp.]|nr:thiamine phosphate synthase [Candidatus Methylomirabilis sp.]
MPPASWGLYLVTDRQQAAGRDLLDVVGRALTGGLRAIQLREKDLSTRDLYDLGRRLLGLTRPAGAALLINDRVDVAMALDADGVHLTRRSLPPKSARDLLGPGRLIGISCHSLADVREAVDGGVDFVVLGPVYATPSKAAYGPPVTTALIEEARSACPVPLLAIGGIKTARVPAVMAAGADGVAAISAVMAAPDPADATREILSAIAGAMRT